MSKLEILLLGAPEVRWDGDLVPISRKPPRALLFYLANRGTTAGRQELITLFWDEIPAQKAQRRLSQTIAQLRSSLPEPDLIITEGDLIGLNFARVYVDQLEFTHLIDAMGNAPWKTPLQQPLPAAIYENFNKALRLWRGNSFLEGAKLLTALEFDQWLTFETQRVEYLRARVLDRLVDHAEAIGDQDQALEFLRKELEVDSLNELLHERFLRLLLDLGKRWEAREHFRRVKRLYMNDNHQGIPPRLAALSRAIEATHVPVPPAFEVNWHLHPSLDTPLLGRQDELARLRLSYQRGGILFVFGEAGLGKTRLLKEFTAQLAPAPAVSLAACRSGEMGLPFQPYIEVGRKHLAFERWEKFPEVWAKYLLPLVPELKTLRPWLQAEPGLSHQEARAQIMEAIRQMLLMVSKTRRLIFILDDAQWADEASLATAAYLASRPPFDRQALFIVSARLEEKNPELEKLMSATAYSLRAPTIYLRRLSIAEVSEMVLNVFGRPPSPKFAEQLSLETGGNPLFVLETLRTLIERTPQPDLSGSLPFPLAQSINSIVQERLSKLTSAAREVLEAASLTGTEINLPLVRQALKLDETTILPLLEELERRQLIETFPKGSPAFGYHFIHDKIRETLVESISPARRQWLHHQIGQAMENILRDHHSGQAAVLAQHFEAAGDTINAFRYWAQAAKHNRQIFAITEANQAFKRAAWLADQAGKELPEEELYSLFTEWNEVAYDLNDTATLQEQNERLMKLGESRDSSLLKAAALNGLCNAAMTRNEFARGLEYAEQAIQILEKSSNTSLHMRVHNSRGVFLYMQNRWSEAQDEFERVLALAGNSNEPEVIWARANAHFQMAFALNITGWPVQGHEHAQECVNDYSLLNRTSNLPDAYHILSLSSYLLGEHLDAQSYNRQGIELAERAHNWRMLGYLKGERAVIDLDLGNLGSALKHASDVVKLGKEHGHPDVLSIGYRCLGDIYLYLKVYDQAVTYFRMGFETSCEGFWGIDNLIRFGYASCWLGETERGHTALRKGIDQAYTNGLEAIALQGEIFECTLQVYQMPSAQTKEVLTRLYYETSRRSLLVANTSALLMLGVCAAVTGDDEAALHNFQTGASWAAMLSHAWLELAAQHALQHILEKKNKPSIVQAQRIMTIHKQLQASLSEAESEHKQMVLKAFLEFPAFPPELI